MANSNEKHTCMRNEEENMDNTNKHRCMPKEEPDWTSALPDEMIQHILSFLPLKEAVQTSMVSKRWVNLWASMPCLNFSPDVTGVDYRDRIVIGEKLDDKYRNFVETVLKRRQISHLHTFSAKFPPLQDGATCPNLFCTCVNYAINHKARTISIDATIPSFELYASLLSCKSVEEMSLMIRAPNSGQVISEVVNLPRLRRLQVGYVKVDRRSISRLLSGCPVLEELRFKCCSGELLCLFGHNLKCFHLDGCWVTLPHIKENLNISLSLHGNTVKSTIVARGTRVNFEWNTMGAYSTDNLSSFFSRFSLDNNLHDLCDVRSLKLHRPHFKMLDKEMEKIEEFRHLKELTLSGCCFICEFSRVALFLQRSPQLEELHLYNCCGSHYGGKPTEFHGELPDPILVQLSRCSNLKLLHIKLWVKHIRAHQIQEDFLPYSQVFGKLQVVFSAIFLPSWC